MFVLVCWYKWFGVGVIYFRCVRAALCAALGCTVNGLPTFVIINNIVCLSLCRCGPSWCLHFDFAPSFVVFLFRFAVQIFIVWFMSQVSTNMVESICMSYSYTHTYSVFILIRFLLDLVLKESVKSLFWSLLSYEVSCSTRSCRKIELRSFFDIKTM